MKVVIKNIESLPQETLQTLLSLQDKESITVCLRGSVTDLEIDSDKLAREILKKHCGINVQ